MKTVRLVVPADFKLPETYIGSNPQHTALALNLGADAVSYFQKKALDRVRAETHVEAVREATRLFEAQTEDAKVQVEKMALEKKKVEEALKVALARIQAMESSAADIRGQAQRETRETMDALLRSKDEYAARLQATLDRGLETVTTKVEGLQNSITKTFSSSKEKGTLGESIMEGFLKKAFDCDVSVVSKDAQTADIRMTRPRAAYFWEVKNYTRMVTSDEVEKFRRDLRLHPDVRGGCLVSLRTGIVGKTRGGDVDVEFLEDGRFVLYLSNFMARDDPVFALQGLRPLFDTVEELSRPMKEETETIRALEAKAALIVNLLRSHAQVVQKHKNSLVGHRKRMDIMFAEFQGMILEAEAQLQTLLRVALGGDEAAAEAQKEVDTSLSPLVFRKEQVSQISDDRQREFVKWLLVQAEAREGVQVEIKELLERAKVAGYSEKFVRGLREEMFQETAWSKGARYLLGLRWWAPATAQGAAPAEN